MIVNGEKIEEFMEIRGYNLGQVCRKSGIADSTLRHMINGYHVNPAKVSRIADALGVDVRELFQPNRAGKVLVKLSEGGKMPTRAHEADAGLDLYSPVEAVIYPGESVVIDTKVHMAIPVGYVGFIKSKSGLGVKHNITSFDGVIDSGYTGSIAVKLFNHGNVIFKVEQGMKISQLVILPIITPELVEVDELDQTDRGEGGFGSTGVF